jgi:hypothetical protein
LSRGGPTLAPNHALARVTLGFVQIFTKRACQGATRCRCGSSHLDAPGLDANRNYSVTYFDLAAALARLVMRYAEADVFGT